MSSPLEIVSLEGYDAVRNSRPAVAVLAYTRDQKGEIETIGLVTEKNAHYVSGTYTGLVMGGLEKEDSSTLKRAIAELREEAGIDTKGNERWTYLGEVVSSKLMPDAVYCYAVDVTDLPIEKPQGDGSKGETGITFSLASVATALSVNDAILHFCFFKLFRDLYKDQLI